MSAKRRSAMQQLDHLVVQWIAGHSPGSHLGSLRASHWRAYRRALRALLRERAEQGMNAVEPCSRYQGFRRVCLTVYAAVLGRAKR